MKKVALITGASSGIGKELAIIHAQKGGDLVLVARRGKELKKLKNELEKSYSIQVCTFEKDLSKVGVAQELYMEVKAKGIEVEYLFNNAGFGLLGKFHELPWERQYEMLNLNMVFLTHLSHLFLADMIKKGSGKILNISSTASIAPGPLQAVYFATKAYVTFLGNAIFEELSDTNITVTTLMPGATNTEFAKTSGLDNTNLFKKSATAKEVAQIGYEGMLKGKLNIVYGLTLSQKLLTWLIPFLPKKLILKNIRKMQEIK